MGPEVSRKSKISGEIGVSNYMNIKLVSRERPNLSLISNIVRRTIAQSRIPPIGTSDWPNDVREALPEIRMRLPIPMSISSGEIFMEFISIIKL